MNLIDENISKIYSLNPNEKYLIEEVEPITLISAIRLDIIAKFIFLKYRDYAFAEELYKQHICAVTKYSIVEMGNNRKNGYEAYIQAFDELNRNMKDFGYDIQAYPIPVNKHGIPLDGAHRIASALFNKKKVRVVHLPVEDSDIYDFEYFDKYNMDCVWIDFIIKEFVNLFEDVYMVNVWPVASGKCDEFISKLKEYGKIVYVKSIDISYNGMFNYMHQIYSMDDWIGTIKNEYNGTYRKVEPCYLEGNPLVLIVFQNTADIEIMEIKEDLRQLFDIGKHSLHINDTKKEAMEIADILLNENSVWFLNNGNPLKYKKWYKQFLDYAKKSVEERALTSSSVLDVFGIREANDLDYIGEKGTDFDNHNDLLTFYNVSLEQLLYDPHNYFYYRNVKFLSLQNVYEFKVRRRETKDQDDIKLIDTFINEINGNINKVEYLERKILQKKRRIISVIQGGLIRFAHITHTYYFLRKFYHFIIRD